MRCKVDSRTEKSGGGRKVRSFQLANQKKPSDANMKDRYQERRPEGLKKSAKNWNLTNSADEAEKGPRITRTYIGKERRVNKSKGEKGKATFRSIG